MVDLLPGSFFICIVVVGTITDSWKIKVKNIFKGQWHDSIYVGEHGLISVNLWSGSPSSDLLIGARRTYSLLVVSEMLEGSCSKAFERSQVVAAAGWATWQPRWARFMDYQLFKGGTKMMDLELTGGLMPNCDLGIFIFLCVNDRCFCEIKTQNSRIRCVAKVCRTACSGVSAQQWI